MRLPIRAAVLALQVAACGRNLELPEKPTGPIVTSIEPAAAFSGQLLAIRGTGFDPKASNNQVAFPRVTVRAEAIVDDELRVRVPPDSGSGPLSVTTLVGPSAPFGDFTYRGLGQLRRGVVATSTPLLLRPSALHVAGGEVFVLSNLFDTLVGAWGQVLGAGPVEVSASAGWAESVLYLGGSLFEPTLGKIDMNAQEIVTVVLEGLPSFASKRLAAMPHSGGDVAVLFFDDGEQKAAIFGLSDLGLIRTVTLPLNVFDVVGTENDALLVTATAADDPASGRQLALVDPVADPPTIQWIGTPPNFFDSGVNGGSGRLVVGRDEVGNRIGAVASEFGSITLIDLESDPPAILPGEIFNFSGASADSIAIVDGVVAIANPVDGVVLGASVATRQLIWAVRGVQPSRLQKAGPYVVAGDFGDNRVLVIDAATGTLVGVVPFTIGPGRIGVVHGLGFDPGREGVGISPPALVIPTNSPHALLEYPVSGIVQTTMRVEKFGLQGVFMESLGPFGMLSDAIGYDDQGAGWLQHGCCQTVALPEPADFVAQVGSVLAVAHNAGLSVIDINDVRVDIPNPDIVLWHALTASSDGRLFAAGDWSDAERIQLWDQPSLAKGGSPVAERIFDGIVSDIIELESGVWVLRFSPLEPVSAVRLGGALETAETIAAPTVYGKVVAVSPNRRTFLHAAHDSFVNQTTVYVASGDPTTGFEQLLTLFLEGTLTGLVFEPTGERVYAVTRNPDRLITID